MRVLVYEDDSIQAQIQIAVLAQHNIESFAASTVSEARNLLFKNTFQVVLCDWNEGQGEEVARVAHCLHPRPVIYILSGSEASIEGALWDRWLIKPVPPQELIKCLKEVA